VTEPRPKHQAALAMAPKSPRGGMEAPGTKLYSNDIQLRTASVAIRALTGNKEAAWRPSSVLARASAWTVIPMC
jgi:hypothetical protein